MRWSSSSERTRIDTQRRAPEDARVIPRLVAVVVVLWAATAWSREPATAIAPLTTGQTAPAELQRAFADELPRALSRAGFRLMPPNEVDMKIGERPEFLQCRAGGCLAEEATFLRVRRLVLPRLERAADGGVTLGVTVYDAAQRKPVSDAVDRAATSAEVRERLQAMAKKLRAELSRPGRLEVTAQPAAELTIDGAPRGSTPWSGALEPGDHVVALESGGARVERDVSVAPGGMARVDVELAGPAAPAPSRRHAILNPLKWATLAGGVVAVGVGAGLVAIDGQGSCSLAAGQRQCAEVYDTGTGGIVALAGGGALLVTSVILFVADRPRR
jgi:PEGA domain